MNENSRTRNAIGCNYIICYLGNFICGGTSLSLAFAVMHPVECLKNCVQARNPIQLTALFRGFTSSVLCAGPQVCVLIGLWTWIITEIKGRPPPGHVRMLTKEFGWNIVTSVVNCFISCDGWFRIFHSQSSQGSYNLSDANLCHIGLSKSYSSYHAKGTN
jgi:hypothetical protein